MFHLNLKTASAASVPATAAPDVIIDVDDEDSFQSTPSTASGQDGSTLSTTAPSSPQPADTQVVGDHAGYPHCPIFIPSKGRSDLDRSTMATLVRDLVPFVLVVERGEAEAYSALLDRLVGQAFGFAGMVYPTATLEEEGGKGAMTSTTADSKATATAAAARGPDDLWDFPCACCQHPPSSPGTSPAPAAAAAIDLLAARLVTAFHHGYVFEPPTQAPDTPVDGAEDGGEGKACPRTSSSSSPQGSASTQSRNSTNSAGSFDADAARTPASAFVLHDVEEVRSLFQIEVLPEENRGVSYVRNYILQVLVPRVMVACGVDQSGHLEELCLSGPGEHSTLTPAALRSARLEPDVYDALQTRSSIESYLDTRRRRTFPQPAGSTTAARSAPDGEAAAAHNESATRPGRDTPRLLHGLFGFYWVLDDDIYGFYHIQGGGQKHQRLSSRVMLRKVESRLRRLRQNADNATPPLPAIPPAGYLATGSGGGSSGSSAGSSAGGFLAAPQQQQQQRYIFTGREDVMANNFVAGSKNKPLTMHNYALYYTTACFSLEYIRFAIAAAPNSLAVNSYNNIACLFNYALLHNPPQMRYFPPGVPNVRRPEDALVGYLGHSMLWYRFAVREDYDFTLQLIARGLCTLRFRGLAFDVPQMMKVRGGMTDYYRNCHDEIRQQNDRLVLQWPAVAQHWVKGRDDKKRDDIRVHWHLLSPARAKYPGAFLYLNAALPQLQPQRLEVEEEEGNAGVPPRHEVVAGPTAADENAESRKRQRLDQVSDVRATPQLLVPTTTITTSSPSSRVACAATSPHSSRENRGGYVVERWREIDSDEAQQQVGLIPLANENIHIGQTVAVIPPFFTQQPSVVLATVIERSMVEEGVSEPAHVMWTVVAQDVRGMPFLHVKTCYQPPVGGILEAAERVDRYFAEIDNDNDS